MEMLKKFKSQFLLAFTFVALALLAGCSGDTNNNSVTNPNPNTFTPKGTVSGLLRDAVTNQVLVGAKVSIMDKSTTTNDQGLFTIANVPALNGAGNEPANGNPVYPVVIDMSSINKGITDFNAVAANTVKKAFYPSMAFTNVPVTYSSLGETNQAVGNTNATNHDTPVDGFVANIVPFVGKLDANITMQVVGTDLKPISGASVFLYQSGANVAAIPNNNTGANQGAAGAAPGHLVQGPLASDANGFVTFAKIEAKQQFVVKATSTDGKEGWYSAAALPVSVGVNAQVVAQAITAPADGQTDVYAVQGGESFASPAGSAYNTALVITTNDNVAPFILSVSPSNLADISVPTTDLAVVFTFSEPIRSTNYSNAVTRDMAVNNANRGLYNNVVVSYLGPKAGNIAHTIAWSTDRTQLTVTIPVASLTAASRYSVSITAALDGSAVAGDRLTDNNRNNFGALTAATSAPFFTTAGNFNVAAPVIAKTNANSSLAIEWASVTSAASYKVYVARTGVAPYAALGTAANGATVFAVPGFPTFNMLAVPGFTLANGAVYTVKVTTVNGSGSESDLSNEISFSETAPAVPVGLARRAAAANVTEYNIDWTFVAGLTYNVYIELVDNGIGQGFTQVAAAVNGGSYSTAGAIAALNIANGNLGGTDFADGQKKVTYNVKITAVSGFGSESAATAVVVIDDKTTPTAGKAGALAAAPVLVSTTTQGTAIVTFNKPMSYNDIIAPASWAWVYAGATVATVTQTFGVTSAVAAPITLNATSMVATVPWSVTSNGTGTVAAGAVTLSCTAKSVGGALAVTGSF